MRATKFIPLSVLVAFVLGGSFRVFAADHSQAERLVMKEARLEFTAGHFEVALKKYETIPIQSDLWALSLEERAWCYFHLNNYSRALSELQKITVGPFKSLASGETYYLEALTYFALCDYYASLQSILTFKKAMTSSPPTLRLAIGDLKATLVHMQLLEAQVIELVYENKVDRELRKKIVSKRAIGNSAEIDGRHFVSYPKSAEVWIDEVNQSTYAKISCDNSKKIFGGVHEIYFTARPQ